MTDLKLAHGLKFEDLYTDDGLARIDALFAEHLTSADKDLAGRLAAARAAPDDLEEKGESDLLLALAPHVDSFSGALFGISGELGELSRRIAGLAPLYACKRLFVQRRAAKAHKPEDAQGFDGPALEAELSGLFGAEFDQLAFASQVMAWNEDEEANSENLDKASRYAAWALYSKEGRARHGDDILFKAPGKVDLNDLVPFKTIEEKGLPMLEIAEDGCRYFRDTFNLTDHGTDLVGALDEAHYCVICHDRARDYCNRGMTDKKSGEFTNNLLGVPLNGCPLEEKISEMHQAKIDGHSIGSLAIICVDNPLVAATGHRICNDCMKSCIYQKQDPVDIPQVETRVLKDVLTLPWGFEIYSLLTRWNPLNIRRPLPLAESGYKVLIVGSGPAGFALAHFLINEGHTAIAIDGLKIEPLDPDLGGVTQTGERVAFKPVGDINDIYEPLDDRVQAGFGGVAEYGITVRWDKNFLMVVRLLLERRERFSLLGGVRFGSAVTKENAFAMGFDHVALCMGAGKPTFLDIPNGLARGIRQASDFLMALQLTGAAQKDSVANLQIRLPAVTIGGGLTAIDTATEVLAYYVRQVEKFLFRYRILVAESGAEAVRAAFSEEELEIADEFIGHAQALQAEREAAQKEGREARFIDLMNQWGGSIVAYRRKMTGSPSYRLNHEEITKAFEQGIRFAELLAPVEIEVDDYQAVKAIRMERQEIGEDGRPQPVGEFVTLPARSVLVAAGTQPNTVLAREHPGFTELDGKYFQARDENGEKVKAEWSTKPKAVNVLTWINDDGRAMSFFGDLHPSYAGNVVKALASGKQGYSVIDRVLARREATPVKPKDLIAKLNDELRPQVTKVLRLTHNVTQVTMRAPLAAKTYQAGQFYRLQNFWANSAQMDETTRLAMEGMAMTGALVDKEKGEVSVIVLELGGSTNLVAHLQVGERVVLMGPTGAPSATPANETVLLAGGGLGNAVLLDIQQALQEAGSKVLYFAAYKETGDRFHIDHITAHSDIVVWCCDAAPGFETSRPQDKTFVGNVVQAMEAYAKGELGETDIPLGEVDHIIAIGSHHMMRAVGESRHTVLKDYLNPDHVGVASINSPMQCMMKEICAQCLQQHKDPESGERSVVFTCFNQDQPIDQVDFWSLHHRLLQNAVHEKLTRQWIAHHKERYDELRPGV